jgi:hypothetical protein
MIISRRKPKKLGEKNLLQYHVFHHEYHMKPPETELSSLERGQAPITQVCSGYEEFV